MKQDLTLLFCGDVLTANESSIRGFGILFRHIGVQLGLVAPRQQRTFGYPNNIAEMSSGYPYYWISIPLEYPMDIQRIQGWARTQVG